MTNEKAVAARELFLKESFGVLSTISIDVPGYPFGSVTPYCVDNSGSPVLYISYIAQHTKNIMANPKVSLTVFDTALSNDVQAQGRVTCLANAKPIEDPGSDVRDRYFRYFPASRS